MFEKAARQHHRRAAGFGDVIVAPGHHLQNHQLVRDMSRQLESKLQLLGERAVDKNIIEHKL